MTFKLLVDDSRSVDEILDEHYRLFYGPAAAPMQAFFERIERAWTGPDAPKKTIRGQRVSWEHLCTPEKLKRYHSLIRKAAELATEEPYAQRVRLMTEAVYRPMERHCLAYAERAKSRRRVTCPLLTAEPPVVDGKLTDAAWQRASETSPFVALTAEEMDIETTACVMRDSERLYVAFRCPEPNMKQLEATHNEPDKLEVSLDDDVEIFIDVGRTREAYYHLLINPNSVLADRAVNVADGTNGVAWNSQAVVAVAKGDAEWTVEVAIPFEAFGATPNAREVWGFNVCRSRRAGVGGPVQYTAWSPTFGGFNNPDEFGTLLMTKIAGRDDESEIVQLAFEDAPENDKTSIKTNSDISTRLQQTSARLRHTGKGESWNKSVRTDGRHGFGYAFDRTAERYIELRLSDSSGLPSDDFTVMLWFKTAYPGHQVLLASTTSAPLWILSIDEIKSKRYLRFLFATKAPTIAINAEAPPADGQWHHVAVSVDRGSRAVLYLDGKPSGSVDISRHKGPLKNLVTVAGPYHYFDGVLDDVCIYRGAFDEKTIKRVFAGCAGTDGNASR